MKISTLRLIGAAFIATPFVGAWLGSPSSQTVKEECAEINAQFTNGTPMGQVVAKLGWPDTTALTHYLSIPEDTNVYILFVYHFESGDIRIDTTEPAQIDIGKRRFIQACVLRDKK